MERLNYCIAVQSWMGDVARVEQHNAKANDLQHAKEEHAARLVELRTGDPLGMDVGSLVAVRGDLLAERLALLKTEADLARRCALLCGDLAPLAVNAAAAMEDECEKLLAKTVDAIRKAKGLPRELTDQQSHALTFEARATGPYRTLADSAHDVGQAADIMRRQARACENAIAELSFQAKRIVMAELQGVG